MSSLIRGRELGKAPVLWGVTVDGGVEGIGARKKKLRTRSPVKASIAEQNSDGEGRCQGELCIYRGPFAFKHPEKQRDRCQPRRCESNG